MAEVSPGQLNRILSLMRSIIRAKPQWVTLLITSYILIIGVLKWRLSPDLSTVAFLLGGIVGIYFMDMADAVFMIHPSPFKSIVFTFLFAAVSFFVVTSSGSRFAAGLVLSLYFTLLLAQADEWQQRGNLNRWYTLIRGTPSVRMQQWIILGTALFLAGEILVFIR